MLDLATIMISEITVEDMLIVLAAFFSALRGFDHGYMIFRVKL